MKAEPLVNWPIYPMRKNIDPARCTLDIVDTLQDLCPFPRCDLVARICSLGIFRADHLAIALGSLIRSLVAWVWHSVSFAKINLN